MRKEVLPDFGFGAAAPAHNGGTLRKLASIGLSAVKRRFAPEFVNRIDAVITYQPLDANALEAILDQQIAALERHIEQRLEDQAFTLELDSGARDFLLTKGTSREYGARELKRVILRKLTQPLAAMVEASLIPPGSVVLAAHHGDAEQLALSVEEN
jgi:ATP-dependent Clp protease ATP-binding subunit ClpA